MSRIFLDYYLLAHKFILSNTIFVLDSRELLREPLQLHEFYTSKKIRKTNRQEALEDLSLPNAVNTNNPPYDIQRPIQKAQEYPWIILPNRNQKRHNMKEIFSTSINHQVIRTIASKDNYLHNLSTRHQDN